MYVFEARNSNDMAGKVYSALRRVGVEGESRNGRVLQFDSPVSMTYTDPCHRGNFTPGRDANPFFHLAEACWMLAGRRDVEFLAYFNSGMAQYSDNGDWFNAAYGYRMQEHFGTDQLTAAISVLRSDRNSRQAVIQLWDVADLGRDTKDKACNMSMVFYAQGHELHSIVYNRSNDLVYGGVTGANPVHFSFFHQYVCEQAQFKIGKLTFVSANAHVYLDLYDKWEAIDHSELVNLDLKAARFPLGTRVGYRILCREILKKDYIAGGFSSLYIDEVLLPVMNTWILRRNGETVRMNLEIEKCKCEVIRTACQLWMMRRDQ
jgi:hypothetical protein